jgi:hypothetical protein
MATYFSNPLYPLSLQRSSQRCSASLIGGDSKSMILQITINQYIIMKFEGM